MATNTERFGFTLPSGQDPASIIPLNLNTQNIEKYLGMTQDMLAPLYDATEGTYEVDDIVTHDSVLYKCITAVETPEDFDETKWVPTTAVSEGGSGAGAIEKTQTEYDALTPAQKSNGSIYMVQGEAEIIETPVDMSNITSFIEESSIMSVASTTDTTTVTYRRVGSSIGCTFYYTNKIDLTTVNQVKFGLETGDNYHQADSPQNPIHIGFCSTAPSGFSPTFDVEEEYYLRNHTYDEEDCIIDTSELTGEYYLTVISHGWNLTISDFVLEGTGEVLENKIYYMGTEYANTNGGSGGTSEGEGVEIYSEDEYIVGKWIDGKKVYQKTFDKGSDMSISNSSWEMNVLTIANIEKVVECFGISSTGTSYPLNAYHNGDDVNLLACRDGNPATVRHITIRYTKTVETSAPAWGGSVTNNYANFIDTENVIYSTVSSSTTDTYTATEDCYIMQDVVTGSSVATVQVDGETVAEYSFSGTQLLSYNAYLKKGQTITVTHGATSAHTIKVFGITYASGGSSSGSSSVEYSTNEHVVGTWIDGRDVYEKTIYYSSKQGRGSAVIANYPTLNDIDWFALHDISYIVNNTYYEGVSMAMEVACGSSGVALDNNNAPSGFPTDFTNIYVTIRYVKKAVS